MTLRAPHCLAPHRCSAAFACTLLFVAIATVTLATAPAAAQPVSVDPDPFRINLNLEDDTRSVIGAPPRANPNAAFGLYFSGVWERVVKAAPVEGTPNVYDALTERGTPLRISVDAKKTVSTVTIEGPPDIERIGYGFVPTDTERFFTYTDRSAKLDRRGAAVDSRRDSSAVPFALSSRGYGVYVPTDGDFALDFGTSTDLFTFWAKGASVTFHFYTTPKPADIVERFTAESGRVGLPPTAQYGVWKHRTDSAPRGQIAGSQIAGDAEILRAYDVPTSTYVLDRERATSTARFTSASGGATARAAVVTDLKQSGVNVVVDLWPLVEPGTSAFEEAAARRLLVADSTGAPLMVPSPRPDAASAAPESTTVAIVDFTHPDAASWWKDHVAQLARADVDGVVLNEIALPDSAWYHRETPGREIWHTWRQHYVQGTREAFTEAGVKHPVIAGRAVDDGASRSVSLVQTAGWTADFDSTTGLPAAVTAAQTGGLAGTPIWTAAPTRDAATAEAAHADAAHADARTPTGNTRHRRAALARWLQFQAFTPSMHLGANAQTAAWLSDSEMASILRRYTRLHGALSTYLWNQYKSAKATGQPVVRPMMMEVPLDERAHRDDQYFLGPDLLVAPVTDTTTARTVALPPGEWMHLWTHEVYPGDRELEVQAPLNEIPVFVRHNRDALNNVFRPLYKRQRSGIASYLDRRSLTERAPSLTPTSADDTAKAASEEGTREEAAGEESAGEESAGEGAASASDTNDTSRATSQIGALPDVLENAPAATAGAEDLRVFLQDLDEAHKDIVYRERQGMIAPVAARALAERIADLERTTRAILSIIDAG